MTLKEILKDVSLATYKKRSEIHKSDFSNVLHTEATKAFNSSNPRLEVLIYEATISKSRNEFMFNQYKNGYVLNHSVGMRYIKIFFCYNSEATEDSQYKENWDKYYPQIYNQDEADKSGYFWAVAEANNVEGSAVVKGSNFLTPVLSTEIIDENTIKVKCAISPSNIMDSHKDVHIQGIWKKSLNEGKYDLLLQEHEMDFDKVVTDSISGDLKVYTEMISVKELMSKFKPKENKSEPLQDTQTTEPLQDTRITKQLLTNNFI